VNQPTPAIVTQSAVRRLPRLALVLFCVAYVSPGFLGREPWKNADVSAFGVMLEMAAGRSGWWSPQVLGLAVEEACPLPYWLGAAFIRLLPFVSPDFAVRIPFAVLLALTLICTWYTVYHLARQPAAQPVAFAFGGEAQPTDYARALADAGLLALMACLGLAQLSHETTPDLARLAWVSLLLFAASRLAHAGSRRPLRSVFAWGVAVLGLIFSGAPWIAVLLASGLLLVLWFSRRTPPSSVPQTDWLLEAPVSGRDPLLWAALLLVAVLAVAIGLGQVPAPALQTPWAEVQWRSWGKLLVWFTWPAWPLALWTLWRWRKQIVSRQGHRHLLLPLGFTVVSIAATLTTQPTDRALLLGLPALAALAAFALPTLRRSVGALIDWFTLLFFTVSALAIWVIWIAMQTGVPAKPAANVAKLAPGFVPQFSALALVVALAATVGWCGLVWWRASRNRAPIWKSLVLPAGGAALGWVLLMTLWLPLLDYARSYTPQVRSVLAAMGPEPGCIQTVGLSRAQVAALQYHGQLSLQRAGLQDECQWLLADIASWPASERMVNAALWELKATLPRPTDKNDHLLLLRRKGPAR